MAKLSLSTAQLLMRVKQARLAEELVREPYVVAFRATPEEVGMREVEDARQSAFGEDRLARFAERVARGSREAVRFERYLIREGFYPPMAEDDPLGVVA